MTTVIDMCLLDNNCQELCISGVGTYTCDCPTGFRLNDTDNISCVRKSLPLSLRVNVIYCATVTNIDNEGI